MSVFSVLVWDISYVRVHYRKRCCSLFCVLLVSRGSREIKFHFSLGYRWCSSMAQNENLWWNEQMQNWLNISILKLIRDYCHPISPDGRIDVSLNKNVRQNLLRKKQKNECHRRILLDIVRTLGRQGLAFRGASDGENDNENLKQRVNLVCRRNPVLKKWLEEISSRSRKDHGFR